MSELQSLEHRCQLIRQRLPEILIKLPAWPKGFRNWIPPGLFFETSDWTPQKAVHEIEMHLNRLESLSLSQQQAFFLSQKILKQIEILVLLSKKLPNNFQLPLSFKGVTRQQHREELEHLQQMLNKQKNALIHQLRKTPEDPLLKTDMQHIEQKLLEIQDRLTKV